ncbi:hypothetical protein BC835DRAFT_1373530 [Cytidiella melzeri]|nr:hypothetical protein BC835DRAFT_1373530 [Cytidiella melzeri]
MATTSVAERADIHKSCKAMEGVVNLLNDYCDAATAIANIQKKLAKAMRDLASIGCTSAIAINALSSCASVVEALVEVDSKFIKLADKECDSMSADVKKWFKSLAKEERAHDAKIAASNGKIKQAGQTYEKKVKKNPANAAEEHTRYMNVLGTLGPEISQAKYQHAMSVFQQHTTLVVNMAVSVCRIVDAEWLRTCEQVRRVAPSVGQIGECKALCEGGWTGPGPRDLPDVDDSRALDATGRTPKVHDIKTYLLQDMSTAIQASTPAPEYASRATTPTAYSSSQPFMYLSSQKTPSDVQQIGANKEDITDRGQSVNSIASLGSFPTPPAHFPIPPVQSHKLPTPASENPTVEQNLQQAPITSMFSESPESILFEPPNGNLRSEPNSTKLNVQEALHISPSSTVIDNGATRRQSMIAYIEHTDNELRAVGSSSSQTDKVASTSSASFSSTPSATQANQTYKRGDYVDSGEFGVRRPIKGDNTPKEHPRAPSPSNTATAERRDMNRSGSSISVMRERFARSTGPASPPPKDIPRLPLSVTNLATRYEAVAEIQDPRQEPKSLIEERPISTDVRQTESRELPASQRQPSPQSPSLYTSALAEDNAAQRRHRIRELQALEFREQEHEFRLKQRDMEQRTRELEQDRQRLVNARTYRSNSPAQARQATHKPSNQFASNLVESPSSSPVLNSRQPYLSSTSQPRPQVFPSPDMGLRFPSSQSSASQPSSPSLYKQSSEHQRHPDSCGCAACSFSKYNTRPALNPMISSTSLLPPDSPALSSNSHSRTEKPKGWIRRLSMPVMGNAFSSESKKGISSANYMTGVGEGSSPYRNSLVIPDEDGRSRSVVGDPKHRSVTNLVGKR